jgi:hypothetical protein
MNSYEQRIRRRGELARFLDNEWDGKLLDGLLAKERKQQVAQMACRTIHWHVQRARASVGRLVQNSIVPQILNRP